MINKEQCKLNIKRNSFSQRVVNIWNKLPADCANATSVKTKAGYVKEHILYVN